MKVKGMNSSSIKTKNLIKTTFAILLKEKKELNKVTVTELVKRANITRGTFYTHYDNIYEVAGDFQNETLNFLIEHTKDINSVDKLNIYFDEIANYLKENEEIYSMLLTSNDVLIFIYKLENLISKKLYDIFKDTNIDNLKMHISFFTIGAVNMIIKYFRGEESYSIDDINNYMKEIVNKIFDEQNSK